MCEWIKSLGYEEGEQEENGWQFDFWIPMTKDGYRPIQVKGCGIVFELILSEIEQ
jgi:hypothetical protein